MALTPRRLGEFLFFRRNGGRNRLLREAGDLLGGELGFDLRETRSLSLLVLVEQDDRQDCRTEHAS
ncbi:hypothetical protein ACFWIJ_31335 [Streptomyces sp. NPDC127079]|uniref:hypothetical protein n=1 Tax=Streptomyces sp. NPDC127079 TaxID=3347132 RepID=UPI00364A88BA